MRHLRKMCNILTCFLAILGLLSVLLVELGFAISPSLIMRPHRSESDSNISREAEKIQSLLITDSFKWSMCPPPRSLLVLHEDPVILAKKIAQLSPEHFSEPIIYENQTFRELGKSLEEIGPNMEKNFFISLVIKKRNFTEEFNPEFFAFLRYFVNDTDKLVGFIVLLDKKMEPMYLALKKEYRRKSQFLWEYVGERGFLDLSVSEKLLGAV